MILRADELSCIGDAMIDAASWSTRRVALSRDYYRRKHLETASKIMKHYMVDEVDRALSMGGYHALSRATGHGASGEQMR